MALRQNNLKLSESYVTEEVNHVTQGYHDLLARANALADAFSMVGGKYKDYNDAVERAKRWLKETEPKVWTFFFFKYFLRFLFMFKKVFVTNNHLILFQ